MNVVSNVKGNLVSIELVGCSVFHSALTGMLFFFLSLMPSSRIQYKLPLRATKARMLLFI